jgi:uncharacterized protein YuzE
MNPLWTYDSVLDIGYLDLSAKSIVHSVRQESFKTDSGRLVILDFDADDKIIGIEVI